MKKVLLSLAALTSALSANAQVLDFGFETDLATKDTTNWGQYPESTIDWQAQGGRTGQYSLGVVTSGTANRWERVAAFKGLTMEANKSYRVSFWAKGTGAINVALMQGDWNADMPLVAGNGETSVQQVYDATIDDNATYKRVSFVFWHPTEEIQNKFYTNTNNPKAAGEFLRLSFTGEGQYNVDDVLIEESTVKSVVFNSNAIRVVFGYETNGAALAAAAGGTLVLDNSAVSVKVDGETATIESVEIKNDGNLYIFLDSENYALEESSKVSVNFTNPGTLLYSTNVAPECWENPNCAVYNFTAEAGTFDEEFAAESVVYEEAELVSSNPENESFEIDNNISSFSFTFNKAVLANSTENGAPTAVLSNGTLTEKLTLTATEGASSTLTFARAANAAALANGTYTITVDNVCNEKDVVNTQPFSISFEVGKVTIAQTTYTQVVDGTFTLEAGNVASGWTINNEGEMRTAGTSYGSGPRGFVFTNSTVASAHYFRTSQADTEGSVTYGDQEGYELIIPAGDVEFRPILAAWKNPGFKVIVSLTNANGEAVVKEEVSMTANANGAMQNVVFQEPGFRFTSDGGKYIFKAQVVNNGTSYVEALSGGYKIFTYVETEGQKAENEVIFADDFSAYTNNTAPTAESGWAAYSEGNLREAGKDYNYNGDRIFSGLSATNLTAGYYCNGLYGNNSTPSSYLIYGENEGVGPLVLNNQKYQFTWYGVAWKTDSRTLNFQLINEADEVVYSRTDNLTSNMNGSRSTAIEANQIQFSYTPAAGKYRLKFWTDNEAIFGNVKIESVGSMAVQYRNLLAAEVEKAIAERKNADEEQFAGTTRTALDAAIAKYSEPDLHTVEAYNAAMQELKDLVKAMSTRRANITTYASALSKLTELVSNNIDTKFNQLEAYTNGEALVSKYENVESSSLEDADLAEAVASINNAYDLLNNLVSTGITLLTQQVVDLAALITTNDETMAENDAVLAAGNALTDDQDLASKLKLYALSAIYSKIANGYNFTVAGEGEYEGQSFPDSIDVTSFIQNAVFYCTSQDYTAVPENYPGWNITINKGSLVSGWSAGWDPYNGSATNPIVNATVKNAYADTADIVIAQEVSIPVGTYTYMIDACDRSFASWTDGANVFSEPTRTVAYFNTDSVTVNLANMGQYYSSSTTTMMGMKAAADGHVSKTTLGARLLPVKAFGFIDNAKLFLTAKDASFDYATAAAALKQQADAMTGIELQTRNDAPAQVSFFNLNGQRINQAAGVCIKIERYADGYTVVKKVVVK